MYRKAYLFLLIASALIDTTGIVLGQTPNLRAWGSNSDGELGNGVDQQTVSRNLPGQVTGLTGVAAVAGGGLHSLALKGDGMVLAWGTNADGELGNGTNAKSNVPVQASSLAGVVAITGAYYHSQALKKDGTVWAWGYNPYGELGNRSNANSNVPVQVSGLTGVIAIAGGRSDRRPVENDGTV